MDTLLIFRHLRTPTRLSNDCARVFTEAINAPDVEILSIATRPDCLGPEVLELLQELSQIKPVWVELGLQTIHPDSAAFIRRGYELSVFLEAVENLRRIGISVIVHVILGLPGETFDQMLETVQYLNTLDIQGHQNYSFSTYWRARILQIITASIHFRL